ncbi:MAG: MgtC/SapB family protein [Anaerolineales bacterium]|nr:MAG: MgtC/SapB family protein [Anaerolineales bacterium]
METSDLFIRFGAATLIGLLIGIQREYAHGGKEREILAGDRTFALIGLLGCAAALISEQFTSPWVFFGFALAFGTLLTSAYFVGAWKRSEVGLTTEVAALLTFIIGGLCFWNYLALAAAIGVTVTVILALKFEMQVIIERITREDVYATLRFAVITAIILPVLPNQNFGSSPMDVLNPYKIWEMVVLISGISFLGYLLIKMVGARLGIGLSGFLGGLVSSTAVTLSFSQRSRTETSLAKPFALAIIISWTMMFSRVLLLVLVLNIELFSILWPSMLAAGIVALVYCIYLYYQQRVSESGDIQFSNPFELWPAIKFGLFYAGILIVSRAAQVTLGNTGVYLSGLVAGLADVDAITLSMTELSTQSGGVDLRTGAQAIVLAAMANTLVKGGMVVALGARALRNALLPAFILILITGVSVAFLF